LAMLLLEQGQLQRSREILERALANVDPSNTSAVPLLALLVDVHLAAGALNDAAKTVATLEACVADHDALYLTAVRALARGRLAAASSDPAARAWFRIAVYQFADAQLPLGSAPCRLPFAR